MHKEPNRSVLICYKTPTGRVITIVEKNDKGEETKLKAYTLIVYIAYRIV